ncbi:MAG: protein kinase, partial [Acidobacteriota bacterium]|nr:protein kinase [Acidobacteriota bacterium]
AIQIGQGLGAAHDKGIAHRDLKPENILITRDGQVKILDFGLAKLAEPAGDGITQTSAGHATTPGAVLGTVGYMSPEQVRGQNVDHRGDIFALGVILYEMLAGRRAFVAGSTVETMNAILTEDPPSLSGEHSRISPVLDRIVQRCMEKEPDQRFQSGRDIAFALEATRDTTDAIGALTSAPQKKRKTGFWTVSIAILAAVALGFLAGRMLGPVSPETAAPERLSQLTFEEGPETQPSISPDGKSFVYVTEDGGDLDIFFQRVGGETALNLTADSPEDDQQPAFSPDGERIAFRSERGGGGIYLMGATGESVRRLTHLGYNPEWSPDGNSLLVATESIDNPFGRSSISSLYRVDVAT